MASDHVFHQKNWGMSTKRNNKSTTSSPNSSRNCTLHIFCWRFVWNYLEVSSRKLGDVERKQLVSSACAIKSHNGGQEVNLQLHHGKLCHLCPPCHTCPPSRKFCKAWTLSADFETIVGLGVIRNFPWILIDAPKKNGGLDTAHHLSFQIGAVPSFWAIFPILAGHSWTLMTFAVFRWFLFLRFTSRTYTSSCSEHRWRRHPCSWRSYTQQKVRFKVDGTTWEWC